MVDLRPYQHDGVDAVRKAFRAGRNAPLMVMPTGAGKTVAFSYIARGAVARGNRVIIGVHRREIMRQISGALQGFGVEHGLICPGVRPKPYEMVQVASVPTLAARMKKHRFEANLLVVDEAHHVQAGNSWGRVYHGLGSPLALGVTATPMRGDGRGLGVSVGGIFDELIDVVSFGDLVEQGYLAPARTYAPTERLDLTGLRTRAGDWEREELAERVDRPMITGSAVDHYRRLCPGAPAVAFGVSIEHCHHIAAEFNAAGYRFRVIDGTMQEDPRNHLIDGLGRDHDGLVSCDLIGEGVDVPGIVAIILLRPTKSLGFHRQQVGRAARPIYAAGGDLSTVEGRLAAIAASVKPFSFILDHVGNTLTHGLPDTPVDWSLEGVKKRPKKDPEPLLAVRQCVACYAMFRPALACPICGVVQPVASRQIGQEDGELREVTPDERAAIAHRLRRQVQGARTIDDLKRIAAERGYSPRWAEHIMQARERSVQTRVDSQAAAYER